MKEISKVCDGIMKISTLGVRVLNDNQINNKPTKSGNNGIPKGYSTLWRRGVRGEAEPPLKSSKTSGARFYGPSALLVSA